MRAEPQDSSHAAVATDIFVSANGLRFIYKFLKKKKRLDIVPWCIGQLQAP